jgi:ABC-type methionine transport system permease subunit
MSIILQFIRDFLGVLFEGLRDIFFGIILGVYQVFNIPQYIRVFQFYKSDFSFVNWLVAILFVILLLAMFAATIWILVYAVQRAVRLRKTWYCPRTCWTK